MHNNIITVKTEKKLMKIINENKRRTFPERTNKCKYFVGFFLKPSRFFKTVVNVYLKIWKLVLILPVQKYSFFKSIRKCQKESLMSLIIRSTQ